MPVSECSAYRASTDAAAPHAILLARPAGTSAALRHFDDERAADRGARPVRGAHGHGHPGLDALDRALRGLRRLRPAQGLADTAARHLRLDDLGLALLDPEVRAAERDRLHLAAAARRDRHRGAARTGDVGGDDDPAPAVARLLVPA